MKRIILCVLPLLPFLAGCQTNAPPSCAGWTKPPKVNQPVRLVQVEPQLSRWIVATDKFGQKQRCWTKSQTGKQK